LRIAITKSRFCPIDGVISNAAQASSGGRKYSLEKIVRIMVTSSLPHLHFAM
jgi:hypothetical protein